MEAKEEGQMSIEGLPPHLSGSRYCFISDKEKKGGDVWLLAEMIKYVKFVPETNSELVVRLMDDNRTVSSPASTAIGVSNLNSLRSPPTNLIKLEDAHSPGILYALCARYRADQIYTSIGPILVSFNPFKKIRGLYEADVADLYRKGKRNLSDQPHVFALAAECLQGLAGNSTLAPQNQSVIICGESGSGKTEATKQALFYLASAITSARDGEDGSSSGSGSSVGSGGANGRSGSTVGGVQRKASRSKSGTGDASQFSTTSGIESKILLANPILEAWGNAKTLRNNNSSRFGKYIEVFFDKWQKRMTGSSNTTYLLEKSRVVYQVKGERNYHIFYQMLRGEDRETLKALGLASTANNPVNNLYLGQGECVSIDEVDDGNEYLETKSAYEALGFSAEDMQALNEILACICHLASVSFSLLEAGNNDGGVACSPGETVDIGTKYTSLGLCAKILGVDSDQLNKSLTTKKHKSGGNKRNSVVEKPYKLADAFENKNAFAKELFTRSFDWIVEKINRGINSNVAIDKSSRGPGSLIGVLDIFGFEIFDKNSLEQLCINLANETLQAHFNHHIFQEEINLYEREKIDVPRLDYVSNQDVLNLILGTPGEIKTAQGLLRLLDDATNVKGSGDISQVILQKFNDKYSKHPRFKYLISKRLFSIKHYAGEVSYDPSLFFLKNNDRLSIDVIELLTKSTNLVIRDRFTELDLVEDAGRSSKQSVTARFRVQLDGLKADLDKNAPKYIRCIKPNEYKKANLLSSSLVNEQLTYTGVFEAVKIMQSGYPFRLKHSSFRDEYHCLALSPQARRQFFSVQSGGRGRKEMEDASREQIVAMVGIISVDVVQGRKVPNCLEDIKVGTSSVFYRSQQYIFLHNKATSVRLSATLRLQRWGRGASVRFFTSKILKGLKECFRCAVNKDLPAISRLVEEPVYKGLQDEYKLHDLIENFKKILNSPGRLITAPLQVCETLFEELRKLKIMSTSLNDTIKAISKREKTIHDEFPEMERLLADMKAVTYETTLRYQSEREVIVVSWSDDPSMAAVDDRVRRYGIVTRLKERMDVAIGNVDEEDCEAALLDLRSLRASRDVDDVMYREEEGSADSIVRTAAGALNRAIGMVDTYLQRGCMTTSRPLSTETSASLGELEYVVDSSSLRECFTLCQADETYDDRIRSVRTRKLNESVRKLRDLRMAVERGAWEEVREDVKSQGWLDLFGIDVRKKKDPTDVESQETREKKSKEAAVKAKSREVRSFAKRPSTKVPRRSFVTKKKITKKVVGVKLAQLRNREREVFFLDMTTGEASWTITEDLFPAVLFLTHSTEAGKLYYEDLLKIEGATSNDPPVMCNEAQTAANVLLALDSAGCEAQLGRRAEAMDCMPDLEEYLLDVQEGVKARVPVTKEIDVEETLQEEVVEMVNVPSTGEEDEPWSETADLSVLYIPTQLLAGVREEIKHMSIAALHFSIFPNLEKALARDCVSERIFFNGSQLEVSIETEALRRTLEEIEGYSAAFDRTQADYARRARCHLKLRQAASAGDLDLLKAALQDSQEIATANCDFENASKICDFYDMLDTLLKALRHDGAVGTPSLLDFTRISLERMNAALDVGKYMTGVEGSHWSVLLNICETIQAIRVCLSIQDYDAAQAVIAKAAKQDSGWYFNYIQGVGIGFDGTASGSIHHGHGVGGSIYTPTTTSQGYARRRVPKPGEKGCELALTLAVDEIETTKAEIRHISGMRSLVEALDKGPVAGAVGHVLTRSINPTILDVAAGYAKPMLIQTSAVASFLTDIATMSYLRKLFVAEAYGEIIKVLIPVEEETAGFSTCHPALQREFRTIHYEVKDFQAREALLHTLVHGVVKLNPYTLELEGAQRRSVSHAGTNSSHSTISSYPRSSLRKSSPQRSSMRASVLAARVAPLHDLQQAIEAASLVEHPSDTLRQMLVEASIALILREAILGGRWEPSAILATGQMKLTDLYPMLARLGPWAHSVGSIPSAESLVVSLERLGTDMLVQHNSPLYTQQRTMDNINRLIDTFDLGTALAATAPVSSTSTTPPQKDQLEPLPPPPQQSSLYSIFAVEEAAQEIASKEFERLSVSEVLGWAERSLLAGRANNDSSGASYSVLEELGEARMNLLERRYCTALVVGATTGPVRGNIDALDFSYVNDNLIARAKSYVERSSGRSRGVRFSASHNNSGPSERHEQAAVDAHSSMLDVWMQAVEYVVKIRKTATAALRGKLDAVATIKECMSSEDVASILHHLQLTGFPDGELQIILSLVNDDKCYSSLVHALQVNGPTISTDGLLNISMINTEDILTQIALSETFPARSRKLDRLIEYARCCVDLRQGVQERNWGVPANLQEHADAAVRKSLAGTGLKINVDDVLGRIRPSAFIRMADAARGGDSDQENELSPAAEAAAAAQDVEEEEEEEEVDDSLSDVSNEENAWAWSIKLAPVPSVRETLQRFDELEADAVAHPVVGGVLLPATPSFIREEFRLVEREVERQDLLSLFPAAFRSGAAKESVASALLTGIPLNTMTVDLGSISGEALRALVQRVDKWEFASDVVNTELRTLKQAGVEVLRIRRELRRIQAEYKRSFQFVNNRRADAPPAQEDVPLAVDSPEVVARKVRHHRIKQVEALVGKFDSRDGVFKSSFGILDGAIEQALTKVENLHTPPFAFADEWESISSLLAETHAAQTIPAALPEIRLLSSVTITRAYLQKVLRVFYYLNTGDKHIYEDATRAEHLLLELVDANHTLLASFQHLAKQQGKLYKPRGSVKYLLESSIFLLHLVRAEIRGYRELPSKSWGDESFHTIPSFDELRRHQAAGKPQFTVQALLRAVGKNFEVGKLLHPVVDSLFLRAMQDVEDDVAIHEMALALHTGAPVQRSVHTFLTTSRGRGSSHHSSPSEESKYSYHEMDFSGVNSDPLYVALSRVAETKDAPREHTCKIEEIKLLYSSCVVLADLRSCVRAGDFNGGFEVIDAYLGGNKQDAALVVKLIHDAEYVIHPLARAEFSHLTAHICEGYWRAIEAASMEPGMYVRLFTSLLVLSEQSSVVHALCQESSHIVDAPVQNMQRSDRLPELTDPFAPGLWAPGGLSNLSSTSTSTHLRDGYRNNFSQTDGTAIVTEDSVQEQRYHQLVFERESIMHTVETMRDEKARNLKMLQLREAQAIARIDEEERRAFEQIDSIVINDQANFDRLRAELQESWCKLELDRSALRELEETVQRTRATRLCELQDAADRLSRQHITVVHEKRRVAEKKMQLDLLLRQVNLQLARR